MKLVSVGLKELKSEGSVGVYGPECYVLALSLCHALIFLLTCVPPDRFSAFYRTHLGHSRYLDT